MTNINRVFMEAGPSSSYRFESNFKSVPPGRGCCNCLRFQIERTGRRTTSSIWNTSFDMKPSAYFTPIIRP